MNSKYIILAVLFLSFGGILGCDKINEKFFSKTETKETTKEAATIKGPLVAKVNNISIGLDDFNQEIDLYNANVPADRPELKITTKELGN